MKPPGTHMQNPEKKTEKTLERIKATEITSLNAFCCEEKMHIRFFRNLIETLRKKIVYRRKNICTVNLYLFQIRSFVSDGVFLYLRDFFKINQRKFKLKIIIRVSLFEKRSIHGS